MIFFFQIILGHWRIRHLLCKGELLRASLSLSHARSVLVTTGFPTHLNHEPPEKTDGRPSGAIALATCLQALEKEVSVIVDLTASGLFKKLVEDAVEQGEQRDEGSPFPQGDLRGQRVGVSVCGTPAQHPAQGCALGRGVCREAQNNSLV